MKTVHKIATAPAIAFSALAFAAVASTRAMAAVSPSRSDKYCLTYDKGAPVCNYATFAQCQATASGIGAQCDLNYFPAGSSARMSRQ